MPGMKLFLGACLLMLLAPSQVIASESVSALTAFQVLPEKYANGVLKLTADNANPNPTTWYFTAQTDGPSSPMHSITVENGAIIQDKLTLGLREIFANPSPINIGKIQIDSDAAYAIAARYAEANQQKLGGVSFALQQKGNDATPIWTIWCYTPKGSYLGRMEILASDGSVISNDAFSASP